MESRQFRTLQKHMSNTVTLPIISKDAHRLRPIEELPPHLGTIGLVISTMNSRVVLQDVVDDVSAFSTIRLQPSFVIYELSSEIILFKKKCYPDGQTKHFAVRKDRLVLSCALDVYTATN